MRVYCAFAIYKIKNLKIYIEKHFQHEYVLLCNAVHMPKEARLRTRYDTEKLHHAVASPKTRVSKDLNTHAK
jgi:hypothetical protein